LLHRHTSFNFIMSGFGAGQFDDADGAGSMERRIQEELRARQASAAASRVSGALRGQGFSSTDRAFMNSLIAAESAAAAGSSPYYGQQRAAQAHAASTFGRSPYAGLSQSAANAYGVGHNPSDAVAASLYARQRAQYAGAYGAAGNEAQRFHGYGVPGADLYSQHFGRSAQEISLIDRAAAYNAQQRQAEQQNAALLQQAAASKSPSGAISASTLSYMQKGTPKQVLSPQSGAKVAPRQTPTTPATPSMASPAAPKPSPRPKTPKSRPSAARSSGTGSSSKNNKSNLVSTDKGSKDGAEADNAESQKWFSGCVPLGLEDDKYWLSELQVYLRANFAESFGATEEDIAAPMHGRNKPIALGQVGIRCMHCKREYSIFFWSKKIMCVERIIVRCSSLAYFYFI
jgi:hypothetical protein